MAYIKKIKPTHCKVCSRSFLDVQPAGQSFCIDCKRSYYAQKKREERERTARKPLKAVSKESKQPKTYKKSFREYKNELLLNDLEILDEEYSDEELLKHLL
jgi:hypothetical protein